MRLIFLMKHLFLVSLVRNDSSVLWNKKIWAYLKHSGMKTIKNNAINHSMLHNLNFLTLFRSIFHFVLFLSSAVHYGWNFRISSKNYESLLYSINKWIMIQYSNMSCCFIKVGKNWCLDTSFMYLNQIFVDLED